MTCSCDCNAIAIRTICQIDPNNISQNPIYSSSIPRCHVVLFVGTFMCLIKGTKLIVMWESLLSHGLTTSKVNVSSARPHGERWMRGRRRVERTWRRDVTSHPGFALIPAVSLSSRAPGGPTLRGRYWGATAEWGRERGREESVEGENEQAPYSLPRGSVVLISVRISNLNILSS